MARVVVQAHRARGSLAIDPKTDEGAWGAPLPERVTAWDEDATTLSIEAAEGMPRAAHVIVGPGIDGETLRVALDLERAPIVASDPMTLARSLSGPALAIGAPPGTFSVVAALVDESGAPEVTTPRDVSPLAGMVSALRALQETRRVPPTERVPDAPMGAYVPMGTWVEDLPARLRLLAQRCTSCGKTLYPPRGACPACRSRAFEPVALPREARVYAATQIGRGGAPSEFALEQMQVGPYWVAVVEWPEHDVRVTARLASVAREPQIGDPVRAVVRRLFEQEGVVRYGVKFALGA